MDRAADIGDLLYRIQVSLVSLRVDNHLANLHYRDRSKEFYVCYLAILYIYKTFSHTLCTGVGNFYRNCNGEWKRCRWVLCYREWRVGLLNLQRIV